VPFLRSEAIIPLPRDEVFPFFAEAENLERITPGSLRFEITSPLPIRMAEGTLIDYRLRIAGIPQRWRSRIQLWDPPSRFSDEQVRGPYKKWLHTHAFEECAEGTRMIDTVEYELPFGFFGRMRNPIIRRQIRSIFSYRNQKIGDCFLLPKGKCVVQGPIEISD